MPRRSRFERRPGTTAGHRGGDERIELQADRGRAAFDEDDLAQTAIIRWIEIIGEAARGLSNDVRQAHPEVPWRQMVPMRNVLVHGYFDIDTDLVWSVVNNDLPKLEAQIRSIVEEIG